MRGAPCAGLILVLLLASAPVQADSGQREGALETKADILGLAMAKAPQSNSVGAMAVATDDPSAGTTAAESAAQGLLDPHEETWYMWDHDGQQLWAHHADREDCRQILEDNCVSPAVAVAISDDGGRMVVASHVDAHTLPPPGSDTRTLLLAISANSGVVARTELRDAPVDVALSGDGTTIAVLTRSSGPTQAAAHVSMYAWPSGNSFSTPLLANEPLRSEVGSQPRDAHAITISHTGAKLAAVGDHAWFFHGATSPVFNQYPSAAPASAAAFTSGASPLWLIGYADGAVALYAHNAVNQASAYARQPTTGSHGITSLATTPDGSLFAAGDASGAIHLFASSPNRYLGTHKPASSGIHDLSVAPAGPHVYLSFRAGGDIHMHAWDTEAETLTRLWKDEPSATRLAMSGDGDLLAAAVGASLVVYEARHVLAGIPPASPTLVAGAEKAFAVTLRNDGNRIAVANLAPDAPPGWDAAVEPASVNLMPGQSADVEVRLKAPPGQAPGTHTVHLRHAMLGGHAGSTPLLLDVPRIDRMELHPNGTRSLPVEPGAQATFTLDVRNAGNVRGNATIEILDGLGAWTATVAPQRIEVPPGTTRSVQVALAAPADAAELEAKTITARLQGHPDQAVEFTATVGARFGVGLTAPGGIDAPIGNLTPLVLTIRNTGNAIDSFEVRLGALPAGWSAGFDDGQTSTVVRDVPPGEAAEITASVLVGEDARPGERHLLNVDASSQADPEQKASQSVFLNIQAADGPCPQGRERDEDGVCVKGTPGVALPVLVAVLLSAAGLAWQRRRAA